MYICLWLFDFYFLHIFDIFRHFFMFTLALSLTHSCFHLRFHLHFQSFFSRRLEESSQQEVTHATRELAKDLPHAMTSVAKRREVALLVLELRPNLRNLTSSGCHRPLVSLATHHHHLNVVPSSVHSCSVPFTAATPGI